MDLPPCILIVDPDPVIRSLITQTALRHGICAATAGDAKEARHRLTVADYDLITLEAGLPDEPGLSFLAWLRARSKVPLIFVSEYADEADRIIGIEMGADDYIKKPFCSRELMARISAILRRTRTRSVGMDDVIIFAGWRLSTSRRRLVAPGEIEVVLSDGEIDLLIVLAQRAQRTLSAELILDVLRNEGRSRADVSAIRVGISRLRNKLSAAGASPDLVRTVRGRGYVFDADTIG